MKAFYALLKHLRYLQFKNPRSTFRADCVKGAFSLKLLLQQRSPTGDHVSSWLDPPQWKSGFTAANQNFFGAEVIPPSFEKKPIWAKSLRNKEHLCKQWRPKSDKFVNAAALSNGVGGRVYNLVRIRDNLSQNGSAILAVNVCTHNPCKCKHSKF